MRKVDVRVVWKHEEQEFTPWLADEKNFALLTAALGLELQVTGVEVPVGPFSADILAKDTDDNLVVFENQFGKTDHDHLGKALTYAATGRHPIESRHSLPSPNRADLGQNSTRR
jgi:hypothetical protein